MKAVDRGHLSAIPANALQVGQLSRRRLVLLLAASTGVLATLAACGEEKLTRDNYDFPGARKDSTGNYQMRNAQ